MCKKVYFLIIQKKKKNKKKKVTEKIIEIFIQKPVQHLGAFWEAVKTPKKR